MNLVLRMTTFHEEQIDWDILCLISTPYKTKVEDKVIDYRIVVKIFSGQSSVLGDGTLKLFLAYKSRVRQTIYPADVKQA